MVRRLTASLAVLATVLAFSVGPARAGGGWMAPVQERYEPGGTATLVGYTGGPVTDEAFFAYLRPAQAASAARLLRSDLYVGELEVDNTAHAGYLAFRVSVTFDIPRDLPAGDYDVVYCTDPCSDRLLGDLIAGPVSIGVDPARRVVRVWALDDPEIANLAPDALLVGPGYQTTAADLRASRLPAPTTTAALPAPAALPITSAPTGAQEDGEMAWPLPTALVLASAAATGLVLSRRTTRRAAQVGRRPVPASGAAPGRA